MDIPKRTFLMNKKIDLFMNKNQKIDYSTSDSLHNENNGTEYENIDYNQVQTNSDIENVQSQINDLNNETSELQKEISALKQEMNAAKEELKKYKENNPTTGYKLINEYDKEAILNSQINQYSNDIHNKLEEIGNLNKSKEELLKQLNIKKYLSNGKELTDEELEQFEKLAMYAPFLFVAEEMGYKKYNGYEWNYDYNGYDSYNDLINAMKNKGITTEDIDKSLPNGEKIDWSKVESALSKGVTNLDIALSLKLKESNAANIFYQGEATRDFISRIEYMQDSEIEEAYTIYTNQGLDKFKEYLDSKNAVINQREGLISALNFLSTIDLEDPKYQDYIKTHFKGLEDGLEQFGHGMEVFLSPSNSLSKDLTADQYEAMFIATILAQSNSNVDLGVLGEFNALEKVYNLSMAEGNMLPSMLAGTLGSVFGLEGLGAFTMFCSVTGTSAESAYQQGYDLYSSWFYGALSGASEAGLEYLLGGIPGVSKIADKSFLTRIFSEGVEESLQEILDPYLKYMATGEKPEINWESVLEAGIDGMILAAYLNVGEVVINSGVTISSEFLQEHYDEFKSLEASGIEVDFNRITEDGYIESLQKGKNLDIKSEGHIKFLNMTSDQVRLSIHEEIMKLDSNSTDYNSKLDMLHLKEDLELELLEKISVQKENGVAPTKSTDSLSLEQQNKVKTAASEVRSLAVKSEPNVTAIMESLVDSQTVLEGLNFKLKSEDSIQDKIARKLEKGFTIEEAKNSIHDSVRYTLIVSGSYETTVLQKLSILQEQGFEVVDMNNAWGGDIYQGLNVNLKNSDGLYVELQFHTPESFYVKEHLNHELYELSRNTTTSNEIRQISNQIQALNQAIYVGSETTFSFTNPKELNIATSKSLGNLEQKILSRMPKKLKPIEQAKFIYNSLNEIMEYSTSYYFGNKEEKQNIANQQIDINNVESNQIVCDTWSNMFCELLNKNGISAKVIGKNHKWVVIEFKDGSKWVADPTQPYNGMIDLTNAKLGIESGGFFQVTKEMAESNVLLNPGFHFRNAKSVSNETFKNQDLMKKIDMKIGYDYEFVSELFSTAINESLELKTSILDVSSNATDGEMATAKFEKIILPNFKKIRGVEILSYFSAMRESIFTNSESALITYTVSPLENGGYDIIFTIDLDNSEMINYICSPDGTIKKENINGVNI